MLLNTMCEIFENVCIKLNKSTNAPYACSNTKEYNYVNESCAN